MILKIKSCWLNGGNNGSTGQWLSAVDGKLPYLPYPAKDGHDFIGWFTEPDGGTEVTLETEFWSTDDVIIYAHWQERSGSEGNFYGTDVKWTLKGSVVELTGSGAAPENLYQPPWRPISEASTITSVSIGAGITSIPEDMFSNEFIVKDWTIPESVEVRLGPWHDLIAAEEYGQTTRVYVYNNLVGYTFPSPVGNVSSNINILAGYDALGKQLSVQIRADNANSGLLSFDLPLPLKRYDRFSVFAVKDSKTFTPIAEKAERIISTASGHSPQNNPGSS